MTKSAIWCKDIERGINRLNPLQSKLARTRSMHYFERENTVKIAMGNTVGIRGSIIMSTESKMEEQTVSASVAGDAASKWQSAGWHQTVRTVSGSHSDSPY